MFPQFESPLDVSPRRWLIALACAVGLAACGGGGGGEAQGTLRLALTDAPPCGYDRVHVTIEKVRVHRSASAGANDAGWSEIVLPAPRRVDLRTLTNGVLFELGQTALPAGRYTQLRLVLAPNTGADPLANSVTPTGANETPLTTPSAQQSGLKLNVDLEVGANQIADFVLDFDACRSVVRRGASSQYNLKPVITVLPRLTDVGQVEGYVEAAIAATSSVSVQFGGKPVKGTLPAADGRFVLYPVPVGTGYTLVVSATGRVTAAMTGVPVTTAAPTVVSTATVRIVPPMAAASAPRTVEGTVTGVPAAAASVRALQTLPALSATEPETTIEVDWTAVDDATGAWTLSLPIDAPGRTGYVANPTSIGFAAQDAAAGRYRLEASGGATPLTREIDVRVPVEPIVFAFP